MGGRGTRIRVRCDERPIDCFAPDNAVVEDTRTSMRPSRVTGPIGGFSAVTVAGWRSRRRLTRQYAGPTRGVRPSPSTTWALADAGARKATEIHGCPLRNFIITRLHAVARTAGRSRRAVCPKLPTCASAEVCFRPTIPHTACLCLWSATTSVWRGHRAPSHCTEDFAALRTCLSPPWAGSGQALR